MNFQPHPLFASGALQTIAAHALPQRLKPALAAALAHESVHFLRLADGDELALIENAPQRRLVRHVVLLLHGLGSDARNQLMERLAAKLVAAGHRVVRLNHRGVGDGTGRARQIYNAGCSGDVLAALGYLFDRFPQTRISCVGLSLSGNILLRLLGRMGLGQDALPDAARQRFARAFALSPVLDAEKSVRKMPSACLGLFDRHYLRRLKKQIRSRHELFPDLGAPQLSQIRTLFELDDQYTAPAIGYLNASEYYRETSAVSLLPSIDLPAEVVVSLDDPIDQTDFNEVKLSASTRLFLLQRGGHLGFYGDRVGSHGDRFWLEDWLVKRLASEL